MRHQESQVRNTSFEVVHEAVNSTFLLPAGVGHDGGCELVRNRAARSLAGPACRRALKSGQTSSGTLAAKFRMRCAKQHWGAARGKHTSIALMMPGGPSEITGSESLSPRIFMSSKNTVTVSASSLDPAIRCSSPFRCSRIAERNGSSRPAIAAWNIPSIPPPSSADQSGSRCGSPGHAAHHARSNLVQRNSTTPDIIAAERLLVRIANDDLIAGILNRNKLVTCHGTGRVSA